MSETVSFSSFLKCKETQYSNKPLTTYYNTTSLFGWVNTVSWSMQHCLILFDESIPKARLEFVIDFCHGRMTVRLRKLLWNNNSFAVSKPQSLLQMRGNDGNFFKKLVFFTSCTSKYKHFLPPSILYYKGKGFILFPLDTHDECKNEDKGNHDNKWDHDSENGIAEVVSDGDLWSTDRLVRRSGE